MAKAAGPAVSVRVPCYRGAAHLAAAIESVLTQTFTDLELIIIDDHSPDNTDEVVASFADPGIGFISKLLANPGFTTMRLDMFASNALSKINGLRRAVLHRFLAMEVCKT